MQITAGFIGLRLTVLQYSDAVGQGGVSCSEDGFSKDAKLDVVSVAV